MRPVNLIPPEERRGDRAPLRRGPLAYALVGALALIVVLVVATVLVSNSVVERESELAAAEAELEQVTAEAEALAPYAQFVSAQQALEATVVSLANSRFDWERVLRELALVIPNDVWLTKLSGSASGDPGSDLSGELSGPGLAIDGCARDHEAVARFVAALGDIDGVTRVGLADSVRGGDNGGGCAGRGKPAKFHALIAFDAVGAEPVDNSPSSSSPASAPADEAAPSDKATAAAAGAKDGKGAPNVVAGVAP